MGNISWTKSWSASDNGTVMGGADIQNLQNDITTVVNGGITNANVSASAAIAESKISFDSSAGHDHDGTDSKAVAPMKHYRKGYTIKAGTTADEDIVVNPGVADIGGEQLIAVAASSDIDVNDAGNWVNGSATVSSWCYVYAYDNSGTVAFKLCDEPPDLSFDDDTTAEYPLRYQKYSTTYYRCLGAVYIDAAGDLCWGHSGSEGRFVTQFDASNTCVMCGLGTGSDQELATIWTPKYAKTIIGDDAPADGENINIYEATLEMLDGTWDATLLNVMHVSHATDQHEWEDEQVAGAIKTMTAQSAGGAGHVDMHAHTDGHFLYFMATTDLV